MNYYVLKSIEFGPVILKRLYDQLEPSRYDERPDPHRFTLREAIAHLADWEPIFRARMEQVLANPGSEIVPQDEDERAIQNRYSEQDVENNLAVFAREREITTRLVRTLQPEDWTKVGVRPDYGEMTVEDIANLLVCHDVYHIEQASMFLSN